MTTFELDTGFLHDVPADVIPGGHLIAKSRPDAVVGHLLAGAGDVSS